MSSVLAALRVSRVSLVAATDARLRTIPNLRVYLRTAGHRLGIPDRERVPTVSATDQRVRPYVVQHPSAGATSTDSRLDGSTPGLYWTTRLTLVTGDESAMDRLVDLVDSALEGWRPDVVSVTAALRAPRGFEPGPARRESDIAPPRFSSSLLYGLPT